MLAGTRDMAPIRVVAASRRPRRSNSAGTLATVMTSCGDVARLVERLDGGGEELQRRIEVAVGGVEAGGVAGDEAGEEADTVLPDELDALVPRRQRALGVRLGEGQPDDPQRVGDPVGVPDLARRGHRLLGQRERLLDATRRLQAVDVRRDPVARDGPGSRATVLVSST